MGSSNGKIISNSIIYTVSGILIKCFSFFLLPLYTAYLTTEDYGITNIANSFINVMSFVAAFSLYSAIMRFYVDLKDDEEKLSRFYGTIVSFVAVSCIFVCLVLFLLRDPVEKYIFSGIPFFPVILIVSISLLFQCEHTIYDNILRSQQKAFKSSVLSIAYFFVTVVLNIIFVVVLKMGAVGTLLAGTISASIYTVYFISDMLRTRQITFCFDFKLLKSALKYSIPILPHNLSTHIATFVSSVLIGNTGTFGALGVYSVATQFGHIADTVQNYVNHAYGPWLFEKLHSKEAGYKSSIRQVVNMLVSVIGLLFIGIALFAHDYIVLLVDKDFVGAWRYVPFITLVYAIKTIYYFYVNILFYFKKASKVLFTATLSGSIINVILSSVLIPAYGAFGSIIADAVAMIIRVGIIVFISKRFEDIGLKVKDFILNFLIVCAFVFTGLIFSYTKYGNTFNILDFIYRIFIVCVYIAYLFIVYRKQIFSFLNSIKSKRGIKK